MYVINRQVRDLTLSTVLSLLLLSSSARRNVFPLCGLFPDKPWSQVPPLPPPPGGTSLPFYRAWGSASPSLVDLHFKCCRLTLSRFPVINV